MHCLEGCIVAAVRLSTITDPAEGLCSVQRAFAVWRHRANRAVDQRRRVKLFDFGVDYATKMEHYGTLVGLVTTTFGLVTSTVTDKSPTCFACHLPATVGWQGFRLISGHLLPTMDPILGARNQRLIRIGQSGIMVLRLRVPIMADAEACRLQPKT